MELVQGRSAGRARSMIAVKKEKMERAANFARVMKELTMLGSFIRLTDYLFVEGLIERAVGCCECLCMCWLGGAIRLVLVDHLGVPMDSYVFLRFVV